MERYIKDFGQRNRHLAYSNAAGEPYNRTDLRAAWFVSHCATQSRRERFAKAMGKHMKVHVYGKCGKHKCSRKDEASCYRQMEKQYKFYLSFENSICADYVTEKFFNILRYNVVPVTYGGANMSAFAPPHSYVDALSFKSVKRLVRHLRNLAEDDAAYASYFWWKDFYEVRNSEADRAQPYCDLCRRLNDPSEPTKVYNDMHKWWISESHCRKIRTTAGAL